MVEHRNARNSKIFYFCPNCGTKLATAKPLSTSIGTQAWIYIFSIILPAIAFLAIKYWPGMKYLRSPDWERKQIGIVALILMAASTILLVVEHRLVRGIYFDPTGGLWEERAALGF